MQSRFRKKLALPDQEDDGEEMKEKDRFLKVDLVKNSSQTRSLMWSDFGDQVSSVNLGEVSTT